MPFAAIVQRIRSLSLSIGQLTFGSFLLVLAVITATSMASVIAIRHIDATFGELQRVQGVGDLAEEIDRQVNELRLAARDFVTDPNAQSARVGEAVVGAERAPEKDPAGTRARTAEHDRRRRAAFCQLPRRHRSRHRPDRAPRRTDRGVAAGARTVRGRDRRDERSGSSPATCCARRTRSPRRCWRTIRWPPSRPRSACGR